MEGPIWPVFYAPSFRHTDVTSVLSQVGIIRADKPAKLRPRDKIETTVLLVFKFHAPRVVSANFPAPLLIPDRGGIHLGFESLPLNLLATEIRFDERNGIRKAKLALGGSPPRGISFVTPAMGREDINLAHGYFGFSVTAELREVSTARFFSSRFVRSDRTFVSKAKVFLEKIRKIKKEGEKKIFF